MILNKKEDEQWNQQQKEPYQFLKSFMRRNRQTQKKRIDVKNVENYSGNSRWKGRNI